VRLVTGAQSSGLPPVRPYAEFRLGYLLGRTPDGSAGERLLGVERSLAALIRRWRAGGTLSAGRDIRLAPATLDALTRWVEHGGGIGPEVLERLGVYHSGAVADAAVPVGWVRVYLDVAGRDPGRRRAHR
jgi:hypothetical protein